MDILSYINERVATKFEHEKLFRFFYYINDYYVRSRVLFLNLKRFSLKNSYITLAALVFWFGGDQEVTARKALPQGVAGGL